MTKTSKKRAVWSTLVRLLVTAIEAGLLITAIWAQIPSQTPPASGAVSGRIRRITLEQVKQSANPSANPLARLGQLSVEAAKQHRLGVQADYFPQFGAFAANVHYTDFLGDILAVRRPLQGSTLQLAVPLLSQNQTIAALTFTQPITPLFTVRQAVRIARADERIAMAKAGVPVSWNAGEKELEEVYFRLLIAQRRLRTGELKIRDNDSLTLYAGTSIELARWPGQERPL
jgi:hypothetical protein